METTDSFFKIFLNLYIIIAAVTGTVIFGAVIIGEIGKRVFSWKKNPEKYESNAPGFIPLIQNGNPKEKIKMGFYLNQK